MNEIYFVTGNVEKINDFVEMTKLKLKQIKLDIDEIQCVDVSTVVEKKLIHAYEIIKKPVMVEDTGLYFRSSQKDRQRGYSSD